MAHDGDLERPSSLELVAAAATASRAAREDLGHAVAALGALSREVPDARACEGLVHRAIGALSILDPSSVAELPDTAVSRALGAAMDALSSTLRTLQSIGGADTDAIASQIARALASLYPVQRGLERALAGGEEAAPVLLQRRRRVLELVPEDDEPIAPPPTESERRRATRVELSVDIGYQSDTNFFTGFSDDVSEGGLFVATYDLLAVGTALTLSFVLPDGHLLAVHGRVAWIREALGIDDELLPGMGVAFDDLDEVSADAIRRYMEVRPPLFHD